VSEYLVREYQSNDQKAFADLNMAWLNEFDFEITEYDQYLLNNPQEAILNHSGKIFMLFANELAVGTLTLIHDSSQIIELGKMTIAKDFRAKGLSRLLLDNAINYAREQGYRQINLLTNSALSTAISLYKKYGFIETQIDGSRYGSRADYAMKLILNN
jgi:ribosomal protein S18 acetylase RimI-like enzyme